MHAVFRAADGDDLLNAQMAHDAGAFGGFEIKPLHPARKDRRRLDQSRRVIAEPAQFMGCGPVPGSKRKRFEGEG